MDRRQLIFGSAALAACKATPLPSDSDPPVPMPAPERDPSPPALDPGVEDTEVFPWGVYVGDPTTEGAEVRVRSTAATVEIVWYGHEADWVEIGAQMVEVEEVTAALRIDGLEAGRAYCVLARADGVHSAVTRFRTPPANGERTLLRLGASSCFGRTNVQMRNLNHTAARDLDLFLQLGDYVYADNSFTLEGYRNRWNSYLERPSCRALAGATALVHTWDDHEVSNNWTLEPGTSDSVEQGVLDTATTVWRQIIPMSAGPGGSGVWRSLAWGDLAELIVLDCRGERGPDMISEEQLAWFEDTMAASTAVFKIVLSSVHLTDHTELFATIQDQDRWQGYPEQRAVVVATCVNTPGTLVITGDMHFGAVQRVDAEGPGNGLWEIAAGPGGSTLVPLDGILEITGQPAQYDLLLEAHSWCELRLDPNTLQVEVDFIGDDGSVLDARTLQL